MHSKVPNIKLFIEAATFPAKSLKVRISRDAMYKKIALGINI